MRIAIASDHAGFDYKEKIKAHKPNGEERGRQYSKKIFEAESIEANAEPVVIRTQTETVKLRLLVDKFKAEQQCPSVTEVELY